MSVPSFLAACTFAASVPLAFAAPFAYVPNEGSSTLSVIDTATDQVVAEIPAGKKPRGTVISLDGRTAYVSDQPNNQLVRIDLVARKQVGTIPLGESPEGVGISPDGRWLAVAVEESNDVAFVNTRTNRKTFVVKVRGKNPEHAVFTPDGRHVFVSAEEGEAVNVIDFAKRVEVKQIPVGDRPRGIGISRDSARAYAVSTNVYEAADEAALRLKEIVQQLDLNTLTPIECMLKLHELKRLSE